jgi:hypothetical protein
VDSIARYLELCRQGRDHFLRNAATAALVRKRSDPLRTPRDARSSTGHRHDVEETIGVDGDSQELGGLWERHDLEVYPLTKKPGAPFPDMITIGRTANNDIVFNDVTVSRFHAYFRSTSDVWYVCDAGSKNGTTSAGAPLEARREVEAKSGMNVRFGDVETTFLLAPDLYTMLVPLTA